MGFNFDLAGITPRDFEWTNSTFNFSETIFGYVHTKPTTTETISVLTLDGQTLLDSNGNNLFVRR